MNGAIKKKIKMRRTDKHLFFWKEFWSQWNMSSFKDRGVNYNCSEQYMMQQKALLFRDKDAAKRIMAADHPRDQQAIGREVKGYDQQLWDENKYRIVYEGNFLRFTQNPELMKKLLEVPVGIRFVEASPKDKVWGIGMAENDHGVDDERNWKGENLLGQVLTELRNDLDWWFSEWLSDKLWD